MNIKNIVLLGALVSSYSFAQNSAKPGFIRDTTPPQAETRGVTSEGFIDVTNLTGWVVDNQSNPIGINDIFQGNDTTFPAQAGGPTEYLAMNFNSTADGTICTWLVMPDLGFLQTVSFWTRTPTGSSWPDRLLMLHSPTGGTTTGNCDGGFGDFTNTLSEVNPALAASVYPEVWTQFSGTINNTGRVAFVYYVTDGGPTGVNSNYIGLDTVEWVLGAPEADVGISKTNNATGATVTGDTVTYSLSASNNGPGDASNTVVSDSLPAQVSYVSNTCGASQAGGTVTWNIGTLANGASAACNIVTTVMNAGSISNTATVSADETDNVAANDSSTTQFSSAVPVADVGISKTNNATGATVTGDSVTYSLSVSNNGPVDASNTVVSDSLPAQVSYVSNTCGASQAGGTVTWNIGTLANGASAACNIVTTVMNSGSISNTATVSADEVDNTGANNSSTTQFSAGVPSADLQLTIMNNSSGVLSTGASVTFTQTVMNNGPGSASNTVVVGSIPSQLNYVSNSCGATLSGSTLTWNVGNLVNGSSQACSITATVAGFGSIVYSATASADEADTVASNNSGVSGVNGPARIIPTLSQYGLLLLLLGMFFVARRRLV